MPNPTVYNPFTQRFNDIVGYPGNLSPFSAERPTGVAFCPVHFGPGLEKGNATVYAPTGHLTASGKPYGSGIAIAPALKSRFPLRSFVRIRNNLNGRSLRVQVTDTGNFGFGHKYVIGEFGTRIVDLPENIAMQLGVEGSAPVTIEL